jgi:hypothetical protein
MASPREHESSALRKRKAIELTESIELCCRRCAEIVGTLPGLRALFHPNGYRHHTWGELKDSASRGCCCCMFIANRLRAIPKRRDESMTLIFRASHYSEDATIEDDTSFRYFLETGGQGKRLSGWRCIVLYIVPHDVNHLGKEITSFFLYHGGE